MKILSFLAPRLAFKRELAKVRLKALERIQMSGYGNSNASNKKRNFLGWKSTSGTADEDITEHLPTLRERSRDLYVSGGISSGAINKIVTNVIGSGLQLNSQIDHEYLKISREQASTIERQIEREFLLWANDKYSCDIAKKL